jgi:tRNA(fMet)-specific endonuclease VapC
MTVIHLLDTNTLVYLSESNPSVMRRLESCIATAKTSTLCIAEFRRGLALMPSRIFRANAVIAGIPACDFDIEAAKSYGDIILQLGFTRSKDMDRLIAGHALSLNATLVTANSRDFADIPNLKTENWLSEII